MQGLLLGLILIAALDSLNPTIIVVQIYLLTTPQPIFRTASYIAGTVLTNFAGGLIIVLGLGAVVNQLLEGVVAEPPAWAYAIQFGLALALLVWGWRMKIAEPGAVETRTPRSLKPSHTFLLGAAVMLNELTTALPYFVAIERIIQAGLNLTETVLLLGVYNLVFAVPLAGLLVAYWIYRDSLTPFMNRIRDRVQRWMLILTKGFLLLLGVVLLADSIGYALGNPLL